MIYLTLMLYLFNIRNIHALELRAGGNLYSAPRSMKLFDNAGKRHLVQVVDSRIRMRIKGASSFTTTHGSIFFAL